MKKTRSDGSPWQLPLPLTRARWENEAQEAEGTSLTTISRSPDP